VKDAPRARTFGATRHPAPPEGSDAAPAGPYFLLDELPEPGSFRLTGAQGRHAATVRRLRVGEPLTLVDGRGGAAAATVSAVGHGELSLLVGSAQYQDPPQLRVTLVQAVPKGERGELAVELATEAGVDAVVPWTAARCVARWSAERAPHGVNRWRAAAREAAKQSRRRHVPTVADIASTAQVAALVTRAAAALVLHESATVPLKAAELPDTGDVVLIVGPEGGVTEEELTVFRAAGAIPVRLGPHVLRTSTAGAVALGALGVLTGRWS
jgi:16S rRNA (uracil1498-N3)-methyltransferase